MAKRNHVYAVEKQRKRADLATSDAMEFGCCVLKLFAMMVEIAQNSPVERPSMIICVAMSV